MHLIVTLLATVVAFFVWYIVGRKHKKFHLEILPIMLGAASIMWMVDGFANLFGDEKKFLGIEPYIVENGKIVGEAGAAELQEYFYQGMNDLALGVVIITAALVIYAIILLIIDPLNLWRKPKEKKEDNK
jgi:energy-coupling factor transporter transmembrane protein EcfT